MVSAYPKFESVSTSIHVTELLNEREQFYSCLSNRLGVSHRCDWNTPRAGMSDKNKHRLNIL